MLSHEFGIMDDGAPEKGKRYDIYSPEKYGCISVADEHIRPLLERFRIIKCFWHTPDREMLGLDYYGVTLIPPESLPLVIDMICKVPELSELTELLIRAREQERFVIHFGV